MILQSGCKIGDNVSMFGSGHGLTAKERRKTAYDYIRVNENVTIENDVVIVPNSIVDRNVPANRLFVRGKII